MQQLHTQTFQKVDLFFKNYKSIKYKKRDMLLHANDISSSIFYIKNGYARVYRISEQGEELTLTILKPNDFFPLTYGINSDANQYYLEAITPLELYKAPQAQFLKFIKADTDVFYTLTSRILIRFDGVLSRVENLVFNNAFTKVAATIHMCAKRFGEQHGNKITIPVPLTHRDIATLIGITRETTSLEMKKLEKLGHVSRIGKLLIVNDLKALELILFPHVSGQSKIPYSL